MQSSEVRFALRIKPGTYFVSFGWLIKVVNVCQPSISFGTSAASLHWIVQFSL